MLVVTGFSKSSTSASGAIIAHLFPPPSPPLPFSMKNIRTAIPIISLVEEKKAREEKMIKKGKRPTSIKSQKEMEFFRSSG